MTWDVTTPACHLWEPPTQPYPVSLRWAEPRIVYVLRNWQAGRCTVCGTARKLVLDHDHRSDAVRGYLCIGCNYREARTIGAPFDAYRTNTPANICGLRGRYGSWYGDLQEWPDGMTFTTSKNLRRIQERRRRTDASLEILWTA